MASEWWVKPEAYYTRDRYYCSKWLAFSCGTILMLSAGLPYAFSIYGIAIQDGLRLTDEELATMAAAATAGGYLAIPAGLFYDWIKKYRRLGPGITAMIGAVQYAVGYSALYLATVQPQLLPQASKVPVLCALLFLANNGGNWLETAATATCVRNFETERGAVVAILKSFLGLSASIYTTLYATLCTEREDMMRLLATVPAVLTLCCAFFIHLVPFRQVEKHSKDHAFHIAFNSALSLAVFQLLTAMYFSTHPAAATARSTVSGLSVTRWLLERTSLAARAAASSLPAYRDVGLMFCAAAFGLLYPIFSLPFVFGGLRAKPLSTEVTEVLAPTASVDATPALFTARSMPRLSTPGAESAAAATSAGPRAPSEPSLFTTPAPAGPLDVPTLSGAMQDEEHDEGYLATDSTEKTLFETLRMADFWILTVASAIITGCGLAFINNASVVVRSLGGTREVTNVVVSLFSVANCLGRMFTGFLPETLFNLYGTPRTHFLVLVSLVCAACSALCALPSISALPAVAFAAGLTFGFGQGLVPTIVSELFGLASFASNSTMVNTTYILSAFGLSKSLFTAVYNANTPRGASVCSGAHCFQMTFYVCAALSLISAGLGTYLSIRRRRFYRRLARLVRKERGRRGLAAVQRYQRRALEEREKRAQDTQRHLAQSLNMSRRFTQELQGMDTRLRAGVPMRGNKEGLQAITEHVSNLETQLRLAHAALAGDMDAAMSDTDSESRSSFVTDRDELLGSSATRHLSLGDRGLGASPWSHA